jgi:hypothetical protein
MRVWKKKLVHMMRVWRGKKKKKKKVCEEGEAV